VTKFVLEVKDVSKSYQIGEQTLTALHEVTFSVEKGELMAIYGESGSGKSTLLHIIGSLETPTTGQVFINQSLISTKETFLLEQLRSQFIGFVFQHNNLLSDFTALENVLFPALIVKQNIKKSRERAKLLLKSVGLTKRESHYPSQLSGGEQQRVAIARALMNEPPLLLADEPTGNLDSKTAESIYEMIESLRKNFRTTIIVVTHSLQFLERATRTLQLKDGRVIHDF
jgi:lipoprotein-releasing system ATP-binding protein